MRQFRKELPGGFRRWWAKWGDTVRFWRVKSLARTAYEDGFEIGARAALQTLFEVQQFALASGTLTEGGDVKQAPGDSLSGPTREAGDAQ